MTMNSLRALRPRDFDYWKAQHLLNRAGFGGTPSQVRSLANLGLNAAVCASWWTDGPGWKGWRCWRPPSRWPAWRPRVR